MDAFAVPLAQALGSRLGQRQVVLDHRPGLAGRLGAEIVARARPDGGTFLIASFDQVIAVGGLAGLAPVTLVALAPAVVLTPAGAPFATGIADLSRRLRDPSSSTVWSYASAGSASLAHLAAQRYLAAAGAAPAVHRPHRDLHAALADLETGAAQLMIAPLPAALSKIRDGRLQALAVTGATRSFALPAIPTLAEAGIEMPPLLDWQALWSPAATPGHLRQSLQQAVAAVLDQQEMVASWNRLGAARGGQPAQVLQLQVQSDTLAWGRRSGT
jgi:tripartite-type tricarboxylate transporter receptor subunit TctC